MSSLVSLIADWHLSLCAVRLRSTAPSPLTDFCDTHRWCKTTSTATGLEINFNRVSKFKVKELLTAMHKAWTLEMQARRTAARGSGCEVLWWVCLCVYEDISRTTRAMFTNFVCMLPMAVAWSSSGIVAICYLLPVLWMTSSFFL